MTTTHNAGTTAATPHKSNHPGLALLIIAGAQLMVVLDASIVNIALPSMGHYFHKSQTDMTWAINAYTLAFGGLLLLGGKAGDILGRRQMFMVGLGLFTLGSFMGGLAHNFETLLIGRIIQGVGAAISSPTALALITTEFEEGKERTRAFGVFSAVAGAGIALGLLLGGVLTQYFTWRWVLFVNVPIGVLLIAGALIYLHDSPRLKGRFDYLGGLLSVIGMTAIVYGFINAARSSWSDGPTIGAFIIAGVFLVAFIALESRIDYAMLPLKVLRNRDRSGSYVVMLIIGAALFGMFFFVTYFVQGVLGYSKLKSGLAFLPVAFTIGIVAQISARLLLRVGARVLIIAGAALMTIGLFWLATIKSTSTYSGHLLPSLVVICAGIGLVFVPLMTVAVSSADPEEAGIASALLNVGQQVGGSIGLSVLTTVFAAGIRHESTAQGTSLANQANAGSIPHSVPDNFQQLLHLTLDGRVPPANLVSDSRALHAVYEVLAFGSARGFLMAAGFAVAALLVSIAMIRPAKDAFSGAMPGMDGEPDHGG